MKKIIKIAFICLLASALAGCVSTTKLYDMKTKGLSAPSQNTVRICNMLTWVYNTCADYDDMSEMLDEIEITREELREMKFTGNYEKPFGRKFSMAADSSDDENSVYNRAKKQAQKIARLMLKKLPPEGGSTEE
ncbi:MAG: hypothetical protein IJL24_08235 [Treponema sp.]|nr:hypothetical protein [Treponema sp.]